MKHKLRSYPLFSVCGLNCGLCPRYYTNGPSRCPGCGGEGFADVHCGCGTLSCCQRKELEYCFECEYFPCTKYEGADLTDSFITHKDKLRDMERAKKIGIDAYKSELDQKVKMLKTLLRDFDDGRRKSYFCTAVNLLDLEDVVNIMTRLTASTDSSASKKEKAIIAAGLFNEIAEKKDISFKLRK